MAWFVPTYHHTNAMDDDVNPAWRVAMFEIMRAVYERQLAQGATSFTQFYKGDGTLGYNLALSDLSGLNVTHLNARTNLTRVRDWIISNLSRFTTTNGGTTVWTKATMEADIGTDLDADPAIPLDSRYWQAMQDALDRMIYAYSELSPVATSFSATRSDSSYSTAQLAWDDRGFQLKTTGIVGDWGIGWGVTRNGVSSYASSVNESANVNFRIGVTGGAITLLGDLIDAFYEYTGYSEHTSTAVDFDIGGDIINVSSAGTGTATATVAFGSPLTSVFSVDTAEPSTVPFIGMAVAQSGIIAILITRLKIYHDLTSVLTDQA